MAKSKKRLLVSLAFLFIAMLVTATTTFAWFSYNAKVAVNGMNMTVTSKGSLLIADGWNEHASGNETDGWVAGWYTTAPTDQAAYKTSFTLSEGTNEGVKLDALTQKATPDGSLVYKDQETAAAAGSYYEYQVWLKSDTGAAMTVYLDPTAAVTKLTSTHKGETAVEGAGLVASNAGINDTADYYATGKKLEKTGTIEAQAANAARIAIYAGDAYKFTINPNDGAGYDVAGHNLASDWQRGRDGAIEAYTEETYAKTAAAVGFDGETANDNKVAIASLNGLTPVKVTIRIYLEGTDSECFNAIYSDAITASLGFVAA